ncbi:FxLYD domain-containing protein [Halobacillus rhizosphaerae]|uniref:FxLYD domain-containing protein n=1 Tax=Halobacillus rhizosphaerae TaxID=3064889 RepID=UPI00398B991E
MKNTGDTPFNLNGSSVTYYNKKEEVITVTSMGITVTPSIVPSGETAYVSVYEPLGDNKPDDFKGAELSPQLNPEVETLEELPPDSVTIQEEPKVTGRVMNNTDKDIESIGIASAIFDKNGNLLGIVDGGEC